jgi:hypothetical protein
MITWLKRYSLFVLLAGCGLSLLGAGLMVGALAAVAWHEPASPIAELPLFAGASDTGESMSMATGPIDDEMEGLFILDFMTGELACAVLNSRTAAMGGVFKTNVIKDLGIEEAKKPAYLMTTGAATFVGRTGNSQPARCVVYVCDQNTGNFGAYSLSWNRTAAQKGVMQTGALVILHKDNARAVKNQE